MCAEHKGKLHQAFVLRRKINFNRKWKLYHLLFLTVDGEFKNNTWHLFLEAKFKLVILQVLRFEIAQSALHSFAELHSTSYNDAISLSVKNCEKKISLLLPSDHFIRFRFV